MKPAALSRPIAAYASVVNAPSVVRVSLISKKYSSNTGAAFQAKMHRGTHPDGRFSGDTIGLAHDGDSGTIDAIELLVLLNVGGAEIAKRRAMWKTPLLRYTRGVAGKYLKLVGMASVATLVRGGDGLGAY